MLAGLALVFFITSVCSHTGSVQGHVSFSVEETFCGSIEGSWPLQADDRLSLGAQELCFKLGGANCSALVAPFTEFLDHSRDLEERRVVEQLEALLPRLGFQPAATGGDGPHCDTIRVNRTSEPGAWPASFTVTFQNGDSALCDRNREVVSDPFVAGGVVWVLSIVPHSAKIKCACELRIPIIGKCVRYRTCRTGELYLRPASGGASWRQDGGDWVAVEGWLGGPGGTVALNMTAQPNGNLQLGLANLLDDQLHRLNSSLVIKHVWRHWATDTWDARTSKAAAVAVRGQLFMRWLEEVMPPPSPPPDYPALPSPSPPVGDETPPVGTIGSSSPGIDGPPRVLLDNPLPASVPLSAPASPSLHIHYSPDVGAWPYASLATPNRTYLYPFELGEDLLWLAADTAQYNTWGELPATQEGLKGCRRYRSEAAAASGLSVRQLCRAEAAILRAAIDSAAAGVRVVLAARSYAYHGPQAGGLGPYGMAWVLLLLLALLCCGVVAGVVVVRQRNPAPEGQRRAGWRLWLPGRPSAPCGTYHPLLERLLGQQQEPQQRRQRPQRPATARPTVQPARSAGPSVRPGQQQAWPAPAPAPVLQPAPSASPARQGWYSRQTPERPATALAAQHQHLEPWYIAQMQALEQLLRIRQPRAGAQAALLSASSARRESRTQQVRASSTLRVQQEPPAASTMRPTPQIPHTRQAPTGSPPVLAGIREQIERPLGPPSPDMAAPPAPAALSGHTGQQPAQQGAAPADRPPRPWGSEHPLLLRLLAQQAQQAQSASATEPSSSSAGESSAVSVRSGVNAPPAVPTEAREAAQPQQQGEQQSGPQQQQGQQGQGQGQQREEGGARQEEDVERGEHRSRTCNVCFTRPVECGLQHGETVHWRFCVPCANRSLLYDPRCPVCREPVDRVVRVFS